MIEIQVPEGARLQRAPASGTPLAELKPGARAVVCAVGGAEDARHRLLELGFVSGTPVRVVRLAPTGDPIQVELHGYHISLRRTEAREIRVRAS